MNITTSNFSLNYKNKIQILTKHDFSKSDSLRNNSFSFDEFLLLGEPSMLSETAFDD